MREYAKAHTTLAPPSGWQAQTKCVRFREFCVFCVKYFYQTAIYFFEHEFLELPEFLLTKVSPCGLVQPCFRVFVFSMFFCPRISRITRILLTPFRTPVVLCSLISPLSTLNRYCRRADTVIGPYTMPDGLSKL